MPGPIYLDYNATTPADPAVVDAMLPFFEGHFGNPSSEHAFGWAADEAVETARRRVGDLIGCQPRNLTFTAGATEAVNLALKGTAAAYGSRKDHLVTVATEHKAVLEAARALERDGWRVTVLPVEPDGLLDLDRLRDALTKRTLLAAVMWVNNETGVVQPIPEIAEVVHEAGAMMMTDATQALGKLPVDVDAAGVDLLALSGHKMYGPKGVGALYRRLRRPRVRIAPLLNGGGHEGGLRSGTLNVPGIVGLGKAAEVAREHLGEEAGRLGALRDRLERDLLGRFPEARVNGADAPRVPNTVNLTLPGAPMKHVLPKLRGVAASTGSACQTAAAQPSHVLAAMGLSDADAFSTLRLSVGRFTTEEEVERAVEEIAAAVEGARERIAA